MKLQDFLSRLTGVIEAAVGWMAQCPSHDDQKASLSISEGRDGRILVHCHAGCRVDSVVEALGLSTKDLFADNIIKNAVAKGEVVATYDYRDENNLLLFQTVRLQPKSFRQRRPDPTNPSNWIWDLNGVRRVLYRLPELKAAIANGQTVFIVEGEKDANALVKVNCVATCNPMGAKKNGKSWSPEFSEMLLEADCVIIADKDEIGRSHSNAVASSLQGIAKSVKLIELPDREGGKVKDAFDFFDAGGTPDELLKLVSNAPQFEPKERTDDSRAKEVNVDQEDGDEINDANESGRVSAVTRLIKLANDFEYFHDSKNQPFASIQVGAHIEVWPLHSPQFRDLLAQKYYKLTCVGINRNAVADAITTLAGRARFESPERSVFLRVAPYREGILIDLGDPSWRVVEVRSTGWQVLDKSPVAFIRGGGMGSLPTPALSEAGSIEKLWEILNVRPEQRPLVVGLILNYFNPDGPYFVGNFVGEQGSAKSTAARLLRMMVDPNENPLRSPPREERDLLTQATNNWCVVLDNLSGLSPWLSDCLCRLSTGGGHSARALYTNGEEFTMAVKRPVILTGIDDVASRPDLAERTIQIELETIPDHQRKSEKELWSKFEAARPFLFSAVLNGLACALRELPNVQLPLLPRMADAALWVTAGETAFGWKTGAFMDAYGNNLIEGATASLEAHPVGIAVELFLRETPEWNGVATDLLQLLNGFVTDELRHSRNWPKEGRGLSVALRRLAPAFRRAGIAAEFRRGQHRMIRLCKAGNPPSFESSPSSIIPLGVGSDADDANDANMHPQHKEQRLVEELV